jgi:hypothetical protein|tara:strand:- start:185 stop:439 length:255 start_codon:yes stop_codon:yes gene_type:complete
MANSTINIEIDVLSVDVMIEVEVQWHMSEANELTIDDFYGYHFDIKTGEYTRIPPWLHKIIETTQLLEEEYLDLIDLNCDENTY